MVSSSVGVVLCGTKLHCLELSVLWMLGAYLLSAVLFLFV